MNQLLSIAPIFLIDMPGGAAFNETALFIFASVVICFIISNAILALVNTFKQSRQIRIYNLIVTSLLALGSFALLFLNFKTFLFTFCLLALHFVLIWISVPKNIKGNVNQ